MMKLSLLFSLAESDFKSRFAGSVLGVLWAFLSPMLTITIYWFVYTVALNGPAVDGTPYLFWLIAGILPWFFLSDGLSGATACYWDYRFLVKKTRFQAGVLPFIRTLSALWVHLPLLAISFLAFSFAGIPVRFGQLWVLFWVFITFLFILSLGRVLAIWCARLKDVSYGLQSAIQLGFWITPIFWNPAELSPILQAICRFNPAAILVSGYRDALLKGEIPTLQSVFTLTGFLLIFFLIGKILNKKITPTLADKL